MMLTKAQNKRSGHHRFATKILPIVNSSYCTLSCSSLAYLTDPIFHLGTRFTSFPQDSKGPKTGDSVKRREGVK